MSFKDDVNNKMDKLKHGAKEKIGKMKEDYGDKADNPRVEAEGREEKQEAKIQQVGDDAKDAVNDVRDKFK